MIQLNVRESLSQLFESINKLTAQREQIEENKERRKQVDVEVDPPILSNHQQNEIKGKFKTFFSTTFKMGKFWRIYAGVYAATDFSQVVGDVMCSEQSDHVAVWSDQDVVQFGRS